MGPWDRWTIGPGERGTGCLALPGPGSAGSSPRNGSALGATLLFAALTGPASAVDAVEDESRRGLFTTTFTQRHEFSAVERQLERFQWEREQMPPEYDLAAETFEVYVPPTYAPDRPHGLLVWAAAHHEASIRWRDVLDRRRLICIAPNRIANPRDIWVRTGLCLDAVHNGRQRYEIDPRRIYIAGFSKGGRVASRLGIVYADVFTGVLAIDGVDWWQNISVPGRKGFYYRGRFRKPADLQMLRRAREQNRYVLMTGEFDGNRDQTKAFFFRGYRRAGFRYAHYLEVPGKGHAPPDAAWFEQGIALLDEPLERTE